MADISKLEKLSKEVTIVEVRDPKSKEDQFGDKFTEYDICIKTTSKAFMISQSLVSRRYSDFVWLRSWLRENNEAYSSKKMPPLPPKKLLKRFDSAFLETRRNGLQKFLKKVIEKNVFLSDKALHLFLQSNMKVKQIEYYLTGKIKSDILDMLEAGITDKNHQKSQFINVDVNLLHQSSSIYEGEFSATSCGSTSNSSTSSSISTCDSTFEFVIPSDCTDVDDGTT